MNLEQSTPKPESSGARAALYLGCLVAASVVFYLRFPTNFSLPNFFAEDGEYFGLTLLHDGFPAVLLRRFNGYYVWGIYLVGALGELIDRVLYGGEFITLPQSFALASYLFFGMLATLPLWLFQRWLPLRYRLAWVVLCCLVPLQSSDYCILGTIGNVKFVFVYLAFLLTLYRHRAPASSGGIQAADLALVICGYTNATVYLLTPLMLLRYWPVVKEKKTGALRTLLADRSFVSLLLLGVALVPQLLIVRKYGIPKMPGYLDGPFNWSHAVEIFAYRTYDYALFYWTGSWMNDVKAVSILFAMLGVAFLATRKQVRGPLAMALYVGFVTTFLFVLNRPGIGDNFSGYTHGGPDQFFYAQSLIFDTFVVLMLYGLFSRWEGSAFARWVPVALLLLSVVPARHAGSWGTNGDMPQHVGTIYSQLRPACARPGETVEVGIYPRSEWHMPVERSRFCTRRAEQDVLSYQAAHP